MKNRKTKIRAYITIDKEEKFLNKMCAEGWKPTKIIGGMIFKFERCEPGEYTARVSCTAEPKGKTGEKKQFITEALIESGAEIVPERLVPDSSMRIYAVRSSALGDFEINTDKESIIADCISRRRMHIMLCALIGAMIVLLTCLGMMYLYLGVASAADTQFIGAVIELAMIFPCGLPIFKYNKQIKRLKKEQEFSE